MLSLYILNTGQYVDARGGETLADVAARLPQLGFTPICAHVNNKNEGLGYPLFGNKTVEFMPVASDSGHRVYIRSLCMMLYKAVHDLMPGATLRIEHSVSHGYYCRLGGIDGTPDADMAARLLGRMKEIAAADIPFERHELTTRDAVELFRSQGLDDKVTLLSSVAEPMTPFYTLDGLADSYYGCLAPSTGMLSVFDLMPYRDGLLLLGPERHSPDRPCQPVTQNKMFEAFVKHLKFNAIVGVRNVGELNEATAAGRSPFIINVSEALHGKYIGDIADEITRRYHDGDARIVLVAGPSSSGKTTFTKRLAVMLCTNLLESKIISLDNYFVDRDKTPLDEHGELDYESIHALDLKLFNEHLNSLIAGHEIEMPYYNFETGMREYRGDHIRLTPNSLLLIEGIHGLNPELTAAVQDRMKYKVYVSALTTISIDDHNWIPTTDNRLLRRIIRDHKYRGASAADTIRRWPSVRRGEEKWIFPYQENADATFNSSLLYELGVMRPQALPVLEEVPKDIPEYAEARRLRKFVSYFTPIPENFIPSTSLMREFLGGSSFHY